MHKMEELKDMLCDELEPFVKKGRIENIDDLRTIDLLTHSIKSLDTIIAMEEAGYSRDDYSYGRGRGSSARRDSMGRYSSGLSNGYSRNFEDAKAEIMNKLRELENMDTNR